MTRERIRTALRVLFGLLFIGAGINHFINPEFYVAIMPGYLPAHAALVAISGVVEIIVGLALLLPKLRPHSGWAAVATLLAVFPANIHMALHPEEFPDIPSLGLWIRLPIQFVLIAWAIWATRVPTES
ncbi:MAG: MauE/DoxX family redox-associated membrane protein [Polyangiales bacterium]